MDHNVWRSKMYPFLPLAMTKQISRLGEGESQLAPIFYLYHSHVRAVILRELTESEIRDRLSPSTCCDSDNWALLVAVLNLRKIRGYIGQGIV